MAKQMLMNARLFCIVYNRSVAWLITQMSNHSVGALLLLTAQRIQCIFQHRVLTFLHYYRLYHTAVSVIYSLIHIYIYMYVCMYKALSLIT